ncbi:MAG TPA: cytochrome c peroxidase [Gemmatimonadales bacterium]
MKRHMRFLLPWGTLLLLVACRDDQTTDLGTGPTGPELLVQAAVSPVAQLGQMLFEDQNLSVNRNQSCRTCHEPAQGFAAALRGVPVRGSVVQGSVAGRFGDRKPPTSAYATMTPLFSGGSNPVGGIFWDGRATGALLGNPAADQALGPFVNPAEQALPDMACLAHRVRESAYLGAYTAVWGNAITSIVFPANTATICSTPAMAAGEPVALSPADRVKARTEYYNIAGSIQQFEATLNRFSARVDLGTLTTLEAAGRKLFSGKGKCHQCHDNKGSQPVFTDFRFHNIGVPRNPANPVYNYQNLAVFDKGLGGFTGRATQVGQFRTPTVRNVGLGDNRTYMHNGVFVSLRQVVDFYNTRDVTRVCTAAELQTLLPAQYGHYDPDGAGPLTPAGCWPPPEFGKNMDTKQMGNLGLTLREVDLIVAYMMAMTDF